MTQGTMLFYGGIIGLAAAVILFVFIIISLKSKKKELQKRLDEKY